MFLIARRQFIDGLLDAKFIFLSLVILIAFVSNAFIYTDSYRQELEDYRAGEAESGRLLNSVCDNLQRMAVFQQMVARPPSSLAFIADGGDAQLPNSVSVNAFTIGQFEYQHRSNERVPVLPALDWIFIIGVLMSLLTILVSYSAVCGEKKEGTLRLVLSNSVSKFTLFFGKYLGLLSALFVSLFVGMALNLFIIVFFEGPALTGEVLWQIGWVVLFALLYISLFLFVSVAISAYTRSPSVALVLLLVIWIIAIVAVPGSGRLVAELSVNVPSQANVRDEIARKQSEIEENAPVTANYWNNDPFAPNVPDRAKLWTDRIEAAQATIDDSIMAQIRQAMTAKNLSSISPFGLLSATYMKLSGTGIFGVESFFENSRRFRQILKQFVVNRDKNDPSTPHLVYGSESWVDPGVFSTKPVPYSSVPRPAGLWTTAGLSLDQTIPFEQLTILLVLNLFMAFVALVGMLRIDPR